MMSEKNVDGFCLTFSSEWTKNIESRDHWIYYWTQASLVDKFIRKDEKILEVGVGSGFLQKYLLSKGWDALSVDIDEDKKPDFVSDASTFEFEKVSPDCFLAFEIFEHIPFPLFVRTVKNITEANPKNIIFSLPVSSYNFFDLKIKIPFFKKIDIKILIPKLKIKTTNHFWELALFGNSVAKTLDGQKRGVVSIKDVKSVFEKCNYYVEEVKKEGRIKFYKASPIGGN